MKDEMKGFYLLQDGTYADPADVEKKDGVLFSKNGLRVAIDGDGNPETLGGGAIANGNVAAANAGKPEPVKPVDKVEQKPAEKPVDEATLAKPSPVGETK
jgi:hypothetical protein